MKNKKSSFTRSKVVAAVLAVAMTLSVGTGALVHADQFDDQINALKAKNAQSQQSKDVLGAQAATLADQVNLLQTQISGLQTQITDNQAKSDNLQRQITAAEAELARQKKVLGDNIRQMYLEGQISTLEMLASSKDLSDFVDKQQYRNSVQSKIQDTLAKITDLKRQLNSQKETLDSLLKQQHAMQDDLASQQAEKDRLLTLNQSEQSALDSQIRANYSQMVSLRQQQAAAIAAIRGSNGTSATGSSIVYRNLTSGVRCGGGYPSAYCNVGLDDYVSDPWGLYYARECVHYVAWGLSQRGINVHFNGNGNANQWEGALRGMSYTDNNPNGAAMVYLPIGSLGHVAMVDQVYGDGWVRVSQYNWQPGMYSTMDLKVTPNLRFFHF